jgi:hypothetical protein
MGPQPEDQSLKGSSFIPISAKTMLEAPFGFRRDWIVLASWTLALEIALDADFTISILRA